MNAIPPNSAILREFSYPVFLKTYKYYQLLKIPIMNYLQTSIIDCPQASTILPFLLTLVVVYLSQMIREGVQFNGISLQDIYKEKTTKTNPTSLLEMVQLPSLPF